MNAIRGKAMPVYGDGRNVRDWLHVYDHADALIQLAVKGTPGDTYLYRRRRGARQYRCGHTDLRPIGQTHPARDGSSHKSLITFVTDRRGHDYRYAIDDSHIRSTMGMETQPGFESGLEETVRWYLHKVNGGRGRAQMRFEPTSISGVLLIHPDRKGDNRGWFSETYRADLLNEAGVEIEFCQDNMAYSAPAGVVRGLHWQEPPNAQDKLIQVLDGAILDVVVDIRRARRHLDVTCRWS